MFRELARKKQKLSEGECVRILCEAKRGVLSVNGDDGYPYGMPMNHWYNEEDGCIYFHCGRHGHRIDAIGKNDKASFCVLDDGTKEPGEWSLKFRSVIVFGRITVVDDMDRIIDITARLSRKFTQDEEYIRREIESFAGNTFLLCLRLENICGKTVDEK